MALDNCRMDVRGSAPHPSPGECRCAGGRGVHGREGGGEWLRRQPYVDPARIGVYGGSYGGSYGGYLTALRLARNADLFAAGVDIHGVHDFTSDGGRRLGSTEWRYEPSDRLAKGAAFLGRVCQSRYLVVVLPAYCSACPMCGSFAEFTPAQHRDSG
jgi:hypothetical protein